MEMDEKTAHRLTATLEIRFAPALQGRLPVRGLDTAFEACSQHLPAQFMPLGAYSYARSHFDHVKRIGRYCSIGSGISVVGSAHPIDWISSSPVFYRERRAGYWGSKRREFPRFDDVGQPVEIGNDVWIGDDVLLGHGVTIGTGAVIAARSIITRDVPPYAIVGGTPAKLIRWRFDEPMRERLLASQWWQWAPSTWDETDPTDLARFLDHAEAIAGNVAPEPEIRMTARDLLTELE